MSYLYENVPLQCGGMKITIFGVEDYKIPLLN